MATKAQEVEILGGGISADSPDPGSFVMNMLRRNGAWRVRKGFGQLDQFDTSMSRNVTSATYSGWGYRRHLGSYYMQTNFGHEQIVSLLVGKCSTTLGPVKEQIHFLYLVNIYDVTTGDRWEEPVFVQTCENARNETQMAVTFDPPEWHGVYETCQDKSYQSWVSAQAASKQAGKRRDSALLEASNSPFFVEYADVLYFGTPTMGTVAYIPCTFRGNRRKGLDDVFFHEWAEPYSETAVIRRAPMVPGPSKKAFAYFNTTDFPSATAATKVGNRVVYASGRTLFFSDEGYPTSVVKANTVDISCDGEITAIAELGSGVVVFTDSETWYYRPSNEFLASSGVLRRVTENTGCASPSAFTRVEEALFWADANGAYLMGADLNMTKASQGLDRFFTDSISNPFTSFYTETSTGYTDLVFQQPQTHIRMDTTGLNVEYCPFLSAVLMTVPGQNLSLCYAEGQWSLWTYTSVVKKSAAGRPVPGVASGDDADNPGGNIASPWLVSSATDLWLIGGMDKETLADATSLDDDIISESYYILQYGRGGAIDRSQDEWDINHLNAPGREDSRQFAGRYLQLPNQGFLGSNQPFNHNAAVYIMPWIEVPQEFVFPSGNKRGATATPGNCPPIPDNANLRMVLLPIQIAVKWSEFGAFCGGGCSGSASASTGTGVLDELLLTFEFDSTYWSPVFNVGAASSTALIDFILPPERLDSAGGYTGGSGKVRLETSGGAASTTGDHVAIYFDSAGSAASTYGKMNISDGKRDMVIYIPMYITGDGNYGGMHITDVDCALKSSLGSSSDVIPAVYAWEQYMATGAMRSKDKMAQPVDWAYKSAHVGLDDAVRVKSRGLYSRMKSHGDGTDKLEPIWVWGTYNTLASVDQKGWTSQIVDYLGSDTNSTMNQTTSIEKIASKNNIRTRVQPTTSAALVDRVFASSGDSATANPTYGSIASTSTGNFLIDDEESSLIATSDSVKGDSFSYMLFGHMQNRAQSLLLSSIKAVFRVVGNRRRRGR